MPELGQNVDWLLNQCEKEPIANNKDLNHHKNRIKILEQEEEKLKILCQKESEEISTLNEILEVHQICKSGGQPLNFFKDLLTYIGEFFVTLQGLNDASMIIPKTKLFNPVKLRKMSI